MLTGFEKETHELTKKEIDMLPIFIEGFKWKVGKEKQITNKELRSRLKSRNNISISDARVRKIINYIRVNKLIVNLVSDNKGYWIATNNSEVEKYVETLTQRINEILRVKNSFI